MTEEQNSTNGEQKDYDTFATRLASLPRPVRWLVLLFAAAGIAVAVIYIFNLAPILSVSYYFILMSLFIPMIFILSPAHKKEVRVTWYSYTLAVVSFITTSYLATQGPSIVASSWVPPDSWQLAVAVVLFVVLLESARRAGGLVFLCIVAFFAFYPLFAQKMPGVLWGPPNSLSRTIGFNIYSGDALLGITTRVVGETLIGFLILAALLVAFGAADFFLKLAMALMGGVRGGAAKVAIIASGLFGSLSGSIFANIIGTGSVTIPTMKRAGFKPEYAGAVEACASTGGMLMPPVMGAVAFIMADFTGFGYSAIVVGAAIPSLLYYFGLFMHIDSYSAKHGLVGLPEREMPSMKEILKEGWPFIVVLGLLVWGLLIMRWERLAPFYSSGLLVLLSLFSRRLRLNFAKIRRILLEIARMFSQTMGLLLPTGFIFGGMMATGVAPSLTAALIRVGGENVAVILAVGVIVCIIFGMMGMIVAAYLMLALTLAPALEQVGGLNPLAIHLFIAYYATLAAITPPVALAAFVASQISGSSPMKTSVTAARLGIVLYILPFAFLFEPALVFQGPIYLTVLWGLLNVLAIVLIAGASEGYLVRFGLVRNWVRPILLGGAIMIGFPEVISTIVGVIIVGLILGFSLVRKSVFFRDATATGAGVPESA